MLLPVAAEAARAADTRAASARADGALIFAVISGLGFRRGAPELPVGQPSTADALLLDGRAGPTTFLRPLPVLQLLPKFGREPLLVQRQAVAAVLRPLQPFPLDQLPVELGAEFLPQRLPIAIAVVIGTCNGFTEILDAFATAASSARICVYNEDILCGDEKRVVNVRKS